MSVKNTVRKKMSMRDYINLVNYFETGELEADLTNCDQNALKRIEIRVMRLTKEEKAKMDQFFEKKPFGVSAKSLIESITKAPVFTPQPVIVQQVVPQKQEQPEAPVVLVEEEVDKPDFEVFPWFKDQTKNGSSFDNIDFPTMIAYVETGDYDYVKAAFSFSPNEARMIDVPLQEIGYTKDTYQDMAERYRECKTVGDVLWEAAEYGGRYQIIMNEPEPDEDESFERFKKYLSSAYCAPLNAPMYTDMVRADKLLLCEGDTIELDPDIKIVYDCKDDMMHDFLFLHFAKKIDGEEKFDIFGKKTSASKVISSLYEKFPNGLPNKKPFYRTRRDAYLAGDLNI
jgi:hypothetical protein